MFTDPLLVTYGASSAQLSLGLNDGANPFVRRHAAQTSNDITGPVTLTIGHTQTRENASTGGSTRHLVKFSRTGPTAVSSGINVATEQVQLVIVNANNASTEASLTQLLQALVSLLVGETDGSVAADAAIDSTVVAKLLNGEG
jgi:hypothetical protein